MLIPCCFFVSLRECHIVQVYFQKLKFIQSAKHWSRGRKSLPLDKMWDELDRLIVKQNVANEEVINWIEVS